MIEYGSEALPARDVAKAMWRGVCERCPSCGEAGLFRAYLKVRDACLSCGEELHHHRTDDAPPYFTIFIVGHFVVGGVLALEKAYAPATWVHLALWLPLTLLGSLWLLPRVKGALVGLQWALRMHGFGGPEHADVVEPDPAADVREPLRGA
jgi:uncharacterized protein (DUF983 family)